MQPENFERRKVLACGAVGVASMQAPAVALVLGRTAALAGGSVLFLPQPAHAVLPLVALTVTALAALFGALGLHDRALAPLRSASTSPSRRKGSFHGLFDDSEQINASTAWRFERGRVVAVFDQADLDRLVVGKNAWRGEAAGVVNGAFGSATGVSEPDVVNGSISSKEFMALSHPKTISNYGHMIPVTPRVPLTPQRQKLGDEYRKIVERDLNARARQIAAPQYSRGFVDLVSGAEWVGVFSDTRQPGMTMAWVDPSMV